MDKRIEPKYQIRELHRMNAYEGEIFQTLDEAVSF